MCNIFFIFYNFEEIKFSINISLNAIIQYEYKSSLTAEVEI